MTNKFAPLVTHLNHHDASSFFYQTVHFRALLDRLMGFDGVRIYLASYSDEGLPGVPNNSGGLMTLIYAPVNLIAGTIMYTDSGDYYILNPGEAPTLISRSLASEWVSNYQSFKLPILTATSGLSPTDTKSILYSKEKIAELYSELDCQEATGIRAFLTSYTDNEIQGIGSHLLRRLLVQFILTETINGAQKEFYIEERPGWDQRKPSGHADLDTGSPCPPEKDCESSSSLPI